MTGVLLQLVLLGVLLGGSGSWAQLDVPVRSGRGLKQEDLAGVLPTSSSNNTQASVTDQVGFLEALLNPAVETIYIDETIVVNSTAAYARLNDTPVILTRNVTIVGRAPAGTFNILNLGLTESLVRIPFHYMLEFRALRLRGVFNLLDEFPYFVDPESFGKLVLTGVYLERTACKRLEDIYNPTVGGGNKGGSGGPRSPVLARRQLAQGGSSISGNSPPQPSPPEFSPPEESSESDPMFDNVLVSDTCTDAFAEGGGEVAYDCYEVEIKSRVVAIDVNGKFGDMGSVAGGEGSLIGPGGTASLIMVFNNTLLRCGLFVPKNCSQLVDRELEACINALLEARKPKWPPPSPLPPPPLPPSFPSPSLIGGPSGTTPSGPPSSEQPSSSNSIPLAAVLAPTLVGSFVLCALVLGGIVWWRRRQRARSGSGGAAGESKAGKQLEPQDSDQIAMGDGTAMVSAKSGGGGGGTGGSGAPRSTKGAGGSGRGRRTAADASSSAASAAGTLSSQGLSSTLTGLTSSLGLSPLGSGNTDATRSITLHHMLGAGSFGRVYYATWQGLPVAVKIIPHSDAANVKVQQEVALCTRFNHPNVLRSLHYVTLHSGLDHQISQMESLRTSSVTTGPANPPLSMETWIVLEYCDAGSLASHLNIKATALASAGLLQGPSDGQDATLCGQDSESTAPTAARGGTPGLTSPETSLTPAPQQRDVALTKMSAVLSVARDIAAGMAYLHSLNVCHGDLKCENVLLCYRSSPGSGSVEDPLQRYATSPGGGGGAEGGACGGPSSRSLNTTNTGGVRAGASVGESAAPFVAKVADFGLSKVFNEASTHMSTATVGTVTHMCPTLLLTGQMRPSCDVFSFGIMLWQLVTGGTPFAGMRYAEIVYKVAVAGMRPEFPPTAPRRLVAMAEACWAADPATRPTFEQLAADLKELLEVADELQAEQDGAVQAAREAAVRPEDIAVAAVSPEDAAVASQWAAAAAAALLE